MCDSWSRDTSRGGYLSRRLVIVNNAARLCLLSVIDNVSVNTMSASVHRVS